MNNEQVITECEQYITGQQRKITAIETGEWDERIARWNTNSRRASRDRQSLITQSRQNISIAHTTIADARSNTLITCPDCGKGRSKHTDCWYCGATIKE